MDAQFIYTLALMPHSRYLSAIMDTFLISQWVLLVEVETVPNHYSYPLYCGLLPSFCFIPCNDFSTESSETGEELIHLTRSFILLKKYEKGDNGKEVDYIYRA